MIWPGSRPSLLTILIEGIVRRRWLRFEAGLAGALDFNQGTLQF